jgi:putative ABC transport system substrate-binding protein
VKRREFITLLGGAAATWPVGASAQGERMRRIGALIGFAETDSYGQASANAFRQGLEQLGWVEGRNIRIDYRFAAGDPVLYKTYADELVGLRPGRLRRADDGEMAWLV